jgi:lipid A 3-O-deacylase
MVRVGRIAAAVVVLAASASIAAAQSSAAPGPMAVIAIGAIGVEGSEDPTAAFDLVFRFAPRALGLRPELGALVTADDASYVWAGFGRDFPFSRRWAAHVGFAAGAYERGNGKDLGHTLEFRSALDVSCQVREDLRVGMAVAHLSNAGLSETNPGVETLALTFAWSPRRR